MRHHLTKRQLARGLTGTAILMAASVAALFAAAHHLAGPLS